MIERYSLPEMAEVFTEEARLLSWLEVELAACEASEKGGLVPAGTADRIRKKARIDAGRAAEIESEVHHDVIAFLTMIAESAGEDARHLHQGMTSSDLVDSALAVILRRAGRILEEGLAELQGTLFDLASRHRETVCIGRSHGVHAEPISFGVKVLGWASEITRARQRVHEALEDAAVGKLSGAVGNFAHLPPKIEADFCERLQIKPEPIATQIVARDRMARLMTSLAISGAAVERIALNIRLAQRTECGELLEPFGSQQKGSSAMPHKRNPILCERLCGLARLLRGYASTAMEDVALWEERDISHSSVERVLVADSFLVLHYMIHTLNRVLAGLDVRVDRMRENLEATRGLIFSQRVLLALVEAGMSREKAYRLVQGHTIATSQGGADLQRRVEADSEISGALGDQISNCFEVTPYLSQVDSLFERAREEADAVQARIESTAPARRQDERAESR